MRWFTSCTLTFGTDSPKKVTFGLRMPPQLSQVGRMKDSTASSEIILSASGVNSVAIGDQSEFVVVIMSCSSSRDITMMAVQTHNRMHGAVQFGDPTRPRLVVEVVHILGHKPVEEYFVLEHGKQLVRQVWLQVGKHRPCNSVSCPVALPCFGTPEEFVDLYGLVVGCGIQTNSL